MRFNTLWSLTMFILLVTGSVTVYGQTEDNQTSEELPPEVEDSVEENSQTDDIADTTQTTDTTDGETSVTEDMTPTTDITIEDNITEETEQQETDKTEQQENATLTINDEQSETTDNIDENATQTGTPSIEVGPVADAGPDKTVEAGGIVMLDGGGSYARNGTIVECQWRVEDWDDDEENLPSLQGESNPTPSFIAPYPTVTPVSGYGVELTVTDSNGLRDSDWVVVRVNTPSDTDPQGPVADAGPDRTVNAGESITLDGTESYARNGTIVSYEWAVEEWDDEEENLPSLQGSDTSTPTFVAPQPTVTPVSEYGIYLTVTDSNGFRDTDWVVVGIETPQSPLLPPVSVPGSDQTVNVGDRVELDGSDSFARNGTLVSYQWTLEDWADEEEVLPQLHDRNKPVAWFIAPDPTLHPRSQYMFELYVTDSNGLTDTQDVRVTIIDENATNTRPIAIAEISDDDICEGRTVTLDASKSHDHDDKDEIVSYRWEVVDGDNNDDFPEIDNTNARRTTADTDDILHSNSGNYEIELTVRDRNGATDTDSIVLSVEKCLYRDDNDDEDQETIIIVTEQPSETLNATSVNRMIHQSLLVNNMTIIQASPNCDPLTNSTNITGQIQPNELRILAFFGDCQIANGTLTLNIQADHDLKLLAGNIGNTTSDMIEVNMTEDNVLEQITVPQQQQIQQTPFGNITTYQIPLNNTMTGTDLETQIQKTITGVNGLALWNTNPSQTVILNTNNKANLSMTFAK